MFRVKSESYIRDMGFVKKNEDWERIGKVNNQYKVLFKIYRGSPYIRHSRTSYVTEEQLRLIHEWTKKGYIEWENL